MHRLLPWLPLFTLTLAHADEISSHAMAAHIRFLADDHLEGRAPGSRGGELAERYIATEYERIGLQPAGEGGTYRQPFDLVGLSARVTAPLTFRGKGKPMVLEVSRDAVVSPGLQAEKAALEEAELVFVGYGITAPEQKWDDFKGVDLKGKVLLVMNNDPSSDPALFAGKTRLYYGRWSYKFEEAARRGAKGAIIIHTDASAGYPWKVVQSSWSGEDFELPASASEPRLQIRSWVTEAAARSIAALGGQDLDKLRAQAEQRDFKPVALGVRVSTQLAVKLRRVQTANVLGLLPGTDPKRRDEWVVYTAHHDHLGTSDAKDKPDRIFNGARDNASGVAALLALAEAMARGPRPHRSILFAAVAAEESGLLGSQYLCAHPGTATGRLAANLNVDGLNIWGKTRDVTVIGLGKSTLDREIERLAKAQGRTVRADPFPDRGFFYRSDQFNFARIGVPALHLESGIEFVGRPEGWGREQIELWEKTDYHQPSDQIDARWNLEGAVEDVRLMRALGLAIANAPKMPAWKPGDEFEAARKRALETLPQGR